MRSLWNLFQRWPHRPSSGWIGIDIGSHSIKLAQVSLSGTRESALHFEVVALPADARLTSESLRTGWLTRLVREEMSHNQGFRGRDAACALSMSAMQFRLLNVPPGSIHERREMIAQELLEDAPSLRQDVEFDYWDAATGAGDELATAVNVLLLSSTLASDIGEAIERAGLRCRLLDGPAYALARSVALSGNPARHDEVTAILDWSHTAAQLIVVLNGQPAFVRMLKDCGVGSLVSATAKALSVADTDCHELLSTVGLPELDRAMGEEADLAEVIVEATHEAFSRLVTEVVKTLAYLRLQRAELTPTRIVLMGGGATIRHVDTRLSFEVGLPVTKWSLPQSESARRPLFGMLAQAAALSDLGAAA